MIGKESHPQFSPAVSMRDFILERRLSVAPHHHAVLHAFADYEGVRALNEYEQQQLELFYIKMGNIALQRQYREDRYPDEYDEIDGDER